MSAQTHRQGFSLLELILSLLVLSVAVLALATALGYTALQLRAADTRTERSVAVEFVQEQLRSMDFDDVTTISSAQADTVGSYAVWWEVTSQSSTIKRVTIFSKGPAQTVAGFDPAVEDSASITLPRIP